MEEDTYEYECMRAELLGVEKPTLDDYLSKKKQKEMEVVEGEEMGTEQLKEAEQQGEDLKNVTGKLQELSNLLSATQKKINRFKVSYGDFTSYLKTKIGHKGANEPIVSNSGLKNDPENITGVDNTSMTSSPKSQERKADAAMMDERKSDLANALDSHVDKLDLLIEKAENCQYSMQHQNKEMKRML